MQEVKKHKGPRFKKEAVLPYTRENYVLFFSGLLIILVGYLFLSKGPWNSFWSLTLAPVLLVVGYCVFLPVALLYQKKKKTTQPVAAQTEQAPVPPQDNQ